MNTSHEHIYYLDPWFIAREYESRTKKPLPSKVSRSSGGAVKGSMGFVGGSSSVQETIHLDQSPESAFWDISDQLEKFPQLDITRGMDIPPLFWVEGILAPLGETRTREEACKPEKMLEEVWNYSICSSSGDVYIRLLSVDSLFRYNIERLISYPLTLGDSFRPHVRSLVRGHRTVGEDRFYLATPLVIIEKLSEQVVALNR